jgi:hypothetical protein
MMLSNRHHDVYTMGANRQPLPEPQPILFSFAVKSSLMRAPSADSVAPKGHVLSAAESGLPGSKLEGTEKLEILMIANR